MESKVNIKKIAELAGVSVATVSRVINQNGRFSAETEARVKKIIEDYHYIPNIVAKGLRTSQTKVIGVIVPDIVNTHFAALVREIEKELFKRGFSTMICNTDESPAMERQHIEILAAQQVGGIIFISGSRSYKMDHDIPVIYVDRRPGDYNENAQMVVVESDNVQGGYIATESLIRKGCRRIAILRALGVDYNQTARYEGYLRALLAYGLENRAELNLNIPCVSMALARETVHKALDNGLQFDGLVCNTDDLALGAVIAVREHGIKIPEEIRIIGYDDIPMAAMYSPKLSSVHQPVDKMAAVAAELMVAMLQGAPQKAELIQLPVYLTERESS